MKNLLTLLLAIFAIAYSDAQVTEMDLQPVSTDNPIARVVKNYFRSNPYDMAFSKFLNHLMNDPTLINKTTAKRTDTSFFFFKGEYNHHSPFGFKADKTEIRLAENEFTLQDSVTRIDTILLYQLLGYSYGKEGLESVKKKFAKFDRRYGKNFHSEDTDVKKGDEIIGNVRNYFVFITPYSPLSIAWVRLDEYQNLFTITIRIKLIENTAALPVPSYDR